MLDSNPSRVELCSVRKTKGDATVTKAEKRMRAAWCSHAIQQSTVQGYFLCQCGCGYVGVCRHCVPTAPAHLPWLLCADARQLVQAGLARCEEGYVYALTS